MSKEPKRSRVPIYRVLTASLAVCLLCGCASFGRGLAQGVLENQAQAREDVRACAVEGVVFHGLAPMLERQRGYGRIDAMEPTRPTLKVIYVHGIGTHQPGHAAELVEGLVETLGLTVRSSRPKRVALVSSADPTTSLGDLYLIRLADPDRTRDLIFYELTWSAINYEAKQSIAFDSSNIFRSRRASINQALRNFVNDALPDPVAFAGSRGDLIREATKQAICWSMSKTWQELPEETTGRACEPGASYGSRIALDDHVLVTHSLGSRIALDALQASARQLSNPQLANEPSVRELTEQLRQKDITLFMLSNQLPLLETGLDPQEITGETARFCGDSAPQAQARFLKSVHMVAFTDPNDVLSYPVPQPWADRYLDSRLCARVTNVTLNLADVRSLFGLGEIADPLKAHRGYQSDERVRNLISHGIGHAEVAPIVAERCTWTATDETLMR